MAVFSQDHRVIHAIQMDNVSVKQAIQVSPVIQLLQQQAKKIKKMKLFNSFQDLTVRSYKSSCNLVVCNKRSVVMSFDFIVTY